MTAPLLLLAFAMQQEATLSIGSHSGGDKSTAQALQANYAVRLKDGEKVSLYAEGHFVASPNRKNNILNPRASRDEAAIFLTPGLRASFLPKSKISPFVVGGFGLGVYEQSQLLQNGVPFPGSRTTNHGAWHYGVGADFAVRSWLAFRGDFRDFYSDNRHNFITSIGFQLRFGKR
jgi:opacity protein-like surface antigen